MLVVGAFEFVEHPVDLVQLALDLVPFVLGLLKQGLERRAPVGQQCGQQALSARDLRIFALASLSHCAP